jgi:diguanylate cyclase (GGDEF)-like protein
MIGIRADGALLGGFSIFALRCFDLAPLAREHVFNCIRDAVLVLDRQQRLIDFNPAALELFPSLGEERLGESISSILPGEVVLEQVFTGSTPQRIEFKVGVDIQYSEVRALPLNSHSRQLGWAVILADVTAQVQLVRKLRRYAETDPLTGVSNRRRFFAAIEEECLRSSRYPNVFSVLIIDLDHFKAINDTWGHLAGDHVLRTASERINECLRSADILGRYGGEEFAVLLPLTGQDGALAVAERIRQTIAATPVEYEGKSISFTASVGVTSCGERETANPEAMLRNADRALYRAKSAGRNRVEVWDEALPAEAAIGAVQ